MEKIGKNFFFNMLYHVFSLLTPILVTPYITRIFEQEVLGINTIVATIVSYFCIFGSLGITYMGTKRIAQANSHAENVENTFWKLYRMQFTNYAVIILVYILFCFTAKSHFNLHVLYMVQLLSYMLDVSWLFQGLEEFRYISIRNILIRITSTIAILFFVKTNNDIAIYVICLLLPQLIVNIGMWLTIFRKLGFNFKIVEFDGEWYKQLILMAIPTLATSMYTILNKSVLGIYRPANEVAIYEQGQVLMRVILSVIVAYSTVVMPRMTGLFHVDDKRSLNVLLEKSSAFVWYLTFGLMFGLLALSDLFISWYLPDSYSFVATELKLCAPMIFIVAAENIFGIQILIPMDKEKDYTTSLICAAVTNVFLCLCFIKGGGITAACICSVFAEGIALVIQILKSKKIIEIKSIFKYTSIFVLAGILMYAIIKIVLLWISNVVMGLIVSVVIGFLSYTLCSFVLLKCMKNARRICKKGDRYNV